MSLVGTLAKVAAGVVVAKGVSGMMGGGARRQTAGGTSRGAAGGGLQDILGQMMGGGGQVSRGSRGGGLEEMLGQVLGGGGAGGRAQSGGLQDMLGQILSGRAAGGAAAGAGGLGGALDELSRLSRPGDSGGLDSGGGFGNVLNQSLERFGEPDVAPTREQEDLAGVLLRAMIQAAKSDGRLDQAERQRLQEKLKDASRSDIDFVNAELQRPVDIQGLVRDVPRGAETQVYMMAALAIDLDENSEAQYLGQLAQGLGIDGQTANAIHDRLGAPRIFR